MIFLKRSAEPNGLRTWWAFSGVNCLGTIQHPGTADWRGEAPDGTRFAETSQRKIVEKMRRYAMPAASNSGDAQSQERT